MSRNRESDLCADGSPLTFEIQPLAIVESCFQQKFAIPRQSGLSPASREVIRFLPPFDRAEGVQGLESSSHIWVQFVFHAVKPEFHKLSIRPPRLGGNQNMGVFATRSPYRPNRLGLSVVKLEQINLSPRVELIVSGGDFLDGTPVVDIKPYIPYADRVEQAQHGFAQQPPQWIGVRFSEKASRQIQDCMEDDRNRERYAEIKQLIVEILRQDPRPAYQGDDYQQHNPERMYGTRLWDFDLRWRYCRESGAEFILVEELKLFIDA